MKTRLAFALFMVGATAFNFVLTACAFFGLLALYGLAIAPLLRLRSSGFVILAAFALAVGIAALAYRFLFKALDRRFGLVDRLGLGKGPSAPRP
ncbi:MAG: hypothetical protein NT080_01930 [Spirochaetes bacterium]|nr:hypothetical protein [Spirochaetota bacterium]